MRLNERDVAVLLACVHAASQCREASHDVMLVLPHSPHSSCPSPILHRVWHRRDSLHASHQSTTSLAHAGLLGNQEPHRGLLAPDFLVFRDVPLVDRLWR
jgi:hypothetical protein